MKLELDGQHILITGGSKGIGLACAQGFLAEGARVTLLSRDPQTLAQARAGLIAQGHDASRVHTQAADLRDPAQALAAIDAAEQAMGPVHVLVNSAGAARRTPAAELAPADWADAMQAKFFTYVHAMDVLVKRMAARGGGAIVNIVGAGGKVASPTHLPGGAANAALMLATAGLASAYGPRGVRVNAVNPGQTHTTRLQQGLEAEARLQGGTPEQALERINARLPLGRIARPEEIADAVLFLASPRASYVTGAILAMDGAVTPIVV